MSNPLEHLNWRYATKKYDTTKKLSAEQLHLITEALRLAPSSFGLQPWKFIHVTSPELRVQLSAAAWGQPQVTEASDLFVLCSMNALDDAHIDRQVASAAKARGVEPEVLAGYSQMMKGSVAARAAILGEWNARQVYIALGVALTVAAENQIDASPMEGFDPQKFDEILGLAQLGVTSRVMLALGFRSSEDKDQSVPRARFAKEDVIIEK
jgi:nitroreductase